MNKKISKKIILLILIITIVAAIYLRYGYKIPEAGGQADLSWEKVEQENVSGYKIYYGTAPRNGDCPPGGYEKSVDAGTDTLYRFSGLQAGTTHYFSVVSYNASKKESCFSGEVKKEIPESILSGILKIVRKTK